MIKAVIFDMDGLLIDSEPLWRQTEIEVFSSLGVPINEDNVKNTMGLRTNEVVSHWYKRYPWAGPDQATVAEQIDNGVMAHINESGLPMAGVTEAIAVIDQAGLPMAIASSSTEAIIDAVLNKLKIRGHMQVIHSAQHEPLGKPHPGVYITAAHKMGVEPNECLAFEDSLNGLLAAKAAKMKCIAIPDAEHRGDQRFGIADLQLDSLHDFTSDVLQQLITAH